MDNAIRPRRSDRVAMILLMLSKTPNKLVTLTQLAEFFGCAKSTISEDMSSAKRVLEQYGIGKLETVSGASGGIRFLPYSDNAHDLALAKSICSQLTIKERIMPGGFLYTVDIFSNPAYMQGAGEIFAKTFRSSLPDVVVTIESSGVPIGLYTAQALGVPLIIARKENRITYGSVVTLNYLSTASKNMQTMSLPRRAVKEGQKALVVDDFTKGGGTICALCDIMKEFSATVVGVGTLIATKEGSAKRHKDLKSLLMFEGIDEESNTVKLYPSQWLNN